MKYILIFFVFLVSTQANGQMLQAIENTIESHLRDNKAITSYIGGLVVTDGRTMNRKWTN